MRAIAVTPGVKGSARLVDLPEPVRQKGEYMVRVLEVGIDGTDREIDAAEYGTAPEGEDVLVIGHESLGEVVEECPGDAGFRIGDLVVATVRRPDPRRCLNCRYGEYDFCLTDDDRERGIKGEHGYLSDFYTERGDFLIGVPEELRDFAVLLEPLSVVEKAFRVSGRIQERMMSDPGRLLVTGAGAIGIYAAFLGRLRGLETLVYSRGPAVGVHGEILEKIGARYMDAEEHTLQEAAEEAGPPDIAIEATGFSPLSWQLAGILHANGVACLLSVTGGDRKAEIPSDRLNQTLVLGNRVVFGSVSSHRRDFEQGVRDLQAVRERWPGLLDPLVTRRLPMDRIREALAEPGPDGLKTVVTVARAG